MIQFKDNIYLLFHFQIFFNIIDFDYEEKNTYFKNMIKKKK